MRTGVFLLLKIGGWLLLGIFLTGALFRPEAVGPDYQALALRQIAHTYLLESCDPTGRIPAVRMGEPGEFLLALDRTVDYDALAQVTRRVLADRQIDRAYSLSLADCASGEIFLGSVWPRPTEPILDAAGPACLGRDQEPRCAEIRLKFREPTESGHWRWAVVGLLVVVGGVIEGRRRWGRSDQPGLAPVQRQTDRALGPQLHFDAERRELRVGNTTHELTYRESKLLEYLSGRPGEVLPRQEIHDAVWGEEGIITGRSLDVFISRLRKKLAAAPGVEIRTVHGIGYEWTYTQSSSELRSSR